MRAVLQRVSEASVDVDGAPVGAIGPGLLVFLGVAPDDDEGVAEDLARRVARLRIFTDDHGKMNRSVQEIGGAALVVSQFTLFADADSGRRPSWSGAAGPELAEPLYRYFCGALAREGVPVETGVFAAKMSVRLVNDGPVTLLLERKSKNAAASEKERP